MACEDTLYMEEKEEEEEEEEEQEEQEEQVEQENDDDDDDEHDDNDGHVKTDNNIITHAVGDNLDFSRSHERFVNYLYKVLSTLTAINEKGDDKSLSISVIVFSPQMETLVCRLLLDVVLNNWSEARDAGNDAHDTVDGEEKSAAEDEKPSLARKALILFMTLCKDSSAIHAPKVGDIFGKFQKGEDDKPDKAYEKDTAMNARSRQIFPVTSFIEKHFLVHDFYRNEFADYVKRAPGKDAKAKIAVDRDLPQHHLFIYLNDDKIHGAWVEMETNGTLLENMKLRAGLLYNVLICGYRSLLFAKRRAYTYMPEMQPQLLLYGCRMRFVRPLPLPGPLSSKIAFAQQHEMQVECAAVQNARLLPIELQLHEGKAFLLVTTGSGPADAPELNSEGEPHIVDGEEQINKELRLCTFEMHNDFSHIEPSKDKAPLMQWILVERTAAGIDQARSFNDQQYRSWSTFTVASITNVRKIEGSTTLDLYVKLPFFVKNVEDSSAWPVTSVDQPVREYLLFPRYINFLMQPLVSNLIGRSNEDDSLFFNLLQDPNGLNQNDTPWRETSRGNENSVLSCKLKLKQDTNRKESSDGETDFYDPMGKDQCRALKECLKKRIMVLWGPPGSGKTTTVGKLAPYLSFLHWKSIENGNPFRILLVAGTHSAVDTAMVEVADGFQYFKAIEQLQKPGMLRLKSKFPVQSSDELKYEIKVVDRRDLQARKKEDSKSKLQKLLENKYIFVAGTTSSVRYMDNGIFDLVIIDEGSQVKVGEALYAIEKACPKNGKILIAGDHKQLKPINKVEYPEPEEGEICPQGSILDAIRTPENTVMLQENFRMNQCLSNLTELTYEGYYPNDNNKGLSLASEMKKSEEFRSEMQRMEESGESPAQRQMQQIALAACQSNSSLISVNLSPDLQGGATLSMERVAAIEAKFAAATVNAFVKNYDVKEKKEACDQVLCVTPHHVQRKAVEANLRETMDQFAEDIFVNTAEKAQGRTAMLVIMCYSVLSEEQKERSAGFLLQHPRLNVALSRARAKIILIYMDDLSQPPAEAFQDEAVQSGYMLFADALKASQRIGISFQVQMSEGSDVSLHSLAATPGPEVPKLNFPEKRSRENVSMRDLTESMEVAALSSSGTTSCSDSSGAEKAGSKVDAVREMQRRTRD
eukprot:g3706.t1